MEAKKFYDEPTVERIAENIFYVLPLLRKRMMRLNPFKLNMAFPCPMCRCWLCWKRQAP